jgi:type II secretory ATPase GspE/PulE/Tfp pilus assembly ATPase PilB-like protein
METPSPAPVIRWPTLPFFRPLEPPPPGRGPQCILQLTNDRTVTAELVRFEPGSDSIDLRVPQRDIPQRLSLTPVRCIRLAAPVTLVPDQDALAAVGTTVAQAAHERAYTVTLTSGPTLSGQTRGFVREAAGLFLFPVEPGETAVSRCFIPAAQLGDVQIGPPLGETLVGKAMVSPDMLASALHKQSGMRRERIGEYLTDRAVITTDELTRALTEQKNRPNVRLGDLLVEANLITPDHLKEALSIQSEHRERRLGDILIEMGAVSVRLIQMALSDKLGIPYVNAREFKIDPLTLEAVDAAFAIRHQVLPLQRSGESLVVAVENPLAMSYAQDLRVLTGLAIVPVIADPSELKVRIAKEYSRLEARISDFSAASQARVSGGREPSKHDLTKAEDLAMQLRSETPQPAVAGKGRESDARVNENTLVRLVNKMIVEAHAQGASDIHIESNPGQLHTRIRFRRDGDMEDYLDLPPAYRNSLVSRIKVMAELDISEHRHPQDGKIDFGKFGPLAIELRVAVVPTANNLEDVVLRILGGMEPHPLEDLGFCERDLRELKRMISRSYGLILVCGPTGSGKTTSLHSILHTINRPDLKIWTAEDPIEITQPGLRQVQVQPKIEWTFAAAMRAFLRADPDVIMVGEMRDVETTKIGIEASLTGHLVFSTLHTNSAAESVTRLLDLGMDPFNFADALIGVLAQRLARALCPECKRAVTMSEADVKELTTEYCAETAIDPATVLARWRAEYGDVNGALRRYEAVGCSSCRDGYKGRLGVYELLVGTQELKHLVRTRSPVPELVRAAQADGMRLLRQDALEKVLGGQLDLLSARAAAS